MFLILFPINLPMMSMIRKKWSMSINGSSYNFFDHWYGSVADDRFVNDIGPENKKIKLLSYNL